MRRTLIVMVKEPRAGRVKTRLGQDIGMTAAAWWMRHQTARLLRRLADPRWTMVLAVAPDRAAITSRAWPAHLPRIAQGAGDLGARMARVMHAMPPGPVCLIGADIPRVQKAHLVRAFAALGSHDAVFGPATDGGFWLVGLKRTTPAPASFFRAVRWSTQHALSDSIATLPRARIALTDTLPDVDRAADLPGT